MTNAEAENLGILIGRAIGRDVIAEAMPPEWTGLDPQDADLIPDGISEEMIETITSNAKAAYETMLNSSLDHGPVTKPEAEAALASMRRYADRLPG
jgi:hypothetical protein